MNSKKNQLTNQASKENLPTTSINNSIATKKIRSNQLDQLNHLNQSTIDEMQQRSSVRNLRVRKLGHVEPSEEEIVYRWLEKNPSFVFEYFVSHASRFMVDQWMLRHSKSNTSINNGLYDDHQAQREFRRTNRSASELWATGRKSSLDPRILAGTSHLLMRSYSCSDRPVTNNKQVSSPMRKISARQFENSTISLEPIFRTTNEGKLSFLPADKPINSISSPKHNLTNRLSNSCYSQISDSKNDSNFHFNHHSSNLQQLAHHKSSLIQQTPDEVNLMLELVKTICNELDIRSICHKILKNISLLTNADRCSLFIVKENANEKYFLSILFDVSSDSDYNYDSKQTCIRVPWEKGEINVNSGKINLN